MSAYWKSRGVWQLKVKDKAICQYIQLLCHRLVKMQMVNGAFQFASVDIANGRRMAVLSGHSEKDLCWNLTPFEKHRT